MQCPSCKSELTIGYGSISCKPCQVTGDPSFWASMFVKARRGERIDPCAFCNGSTRHSEIGHRECSRCGIEYHPHVGNRISAMSEKARAQYIGRYHAMHEHPYRWQYEQEGESRMEYARGWLSAPITTTTSKDNRWLWLNEAKRDASMWRR